MNKDEVIDKILEFELDESNYEEFPTELWKDKEFIWCCIENDHHITAVFNWTDKSLWGDKKFVLQTISILDEKWKKEHLLDYVDKSLKKDKDIVEAVTR